MNRQSTENFQGREDTRCDMIMVATCHHLFIQPRGVHNSKRGPSCPLQIWGDYDASARVRGCNKGTPLVTMGEAARVQRQETHRRSLYLPPTLL